VRRSAPVAGTRRRGRAAAVRPGRRARRSASRKDAQRLRPRSTAPAPLRVRVAATVVVSPCLRDVAHPAGERNPSPPLRCRPGPGPPRPAREPKQRRSIDASLRLRSSLLLSTPLMGSWFPRSAARARRPPLREARPSAGKEGDPAPRGGVSRQARRASEEKPRPPGDQTPRPGRSDDSVCDVANFFTIRGANSESKPGPRGTRSRRSRCTRRGSARAAERRPERGFRVRGGNQLPQPGGERRSCERQGAHALDRHTPQVEAEVELLACGTARRPRSRGRPRRSRRSARGGGRGPKLEPAGDVRSPATPPSY
jgi:hypothetical protein